VPNGAWRWKDAGEWFIAGMPAILTREYFRVGIEVGKNFF
jgi:hypothetical protein